MSDVPLREYFDARLMGLENQFNSKISALEKATSIAAAQMEKRLEGQNEFRGQMGDQVRTYLPRGEYEVAYQRIMEDVRLLRESKATLEGKASQLSVNIAMAVAIIGICLSLFGVTARFFPVIDSPLPSQIQPP